MIVTKKINKRIILRIIAFLWLPLLINAQENNYDSLFENYKKNDLEYQRLVLKENQAKLSYEQTLIENGISFSVTSGTISTKFTDDGTIVSVNPEIEVASTKYNNSSITVSLPDSITIGGSNSGKNVISDSSILLSTDIFSGTKEKRKLSIEKAQRSLLEAQRNVEVRQVSVHTAFLQELRDLFSAYQEVLQADKDYLDELSDFETVKAQGYSTSSAKYRTSSLSVESAKRTYEQKQRNYQSSLKLFENKTATTNIQLDFAIPDTTLVSILDYDKNEYTKIESANWTSYINNYERSIDDSNSLSVQGGYGFSYDETNTENSLKAGLTWKTNGLSISALGSIPLDDKANPGISMNVTWNPTTKKINDINDTIGKYQESIEKIDLSDAQDDLEDTILQKEETKRNLDWQLTQTTEEDLLYTTLLKDMEQWYANGLISESEFREAKNNSSNAKIKLLLCKIDRIMYNNEIISLFIPKTQGLENEKQN